MGWCCGYEAVDLSSDSSFIPPHRAPRSGPTEYSLTADKTQRCQRARKSNKHHVHLHKYMRWLQHLAITSHLLPKPTPTATHSGAAPHPELLLHPSPAARARQSHPLTKPLILSEHVVLGSLCTTPNMQFKLKPTGSRVLFNPESF